MNESAIAIILAAGAGTRMHSRLPKVLHSMLGKPLVRWVIDSVRDAGIDEVFTVVGHSREQVTPIVETDTTVVVQSEQKGTGHAVAMCAPHWNRLQNEAAAGAEADNADTEGAAATATAEALVDARVSTSTPVLITYGDAPLVTPETIRKLIETQQSKHAAVVILTMEPPSPKGYGRIIRDRSGEVNAIVEEIETTPEQAEITEVNSGLYCFDGAKLFDALTRITDSNAKGEYFLTDVIALMRHDGGRVVGLPADDWRECLGINSRTQLAEATSVMQMRINTAHMDAGVTMLDPHQVWIGPEVRLATDVEVLPQVMMFGNTSVAEGSIIGPACQLVDSHVGEESVIGPNTRLTDTDVGNGCTVDETIAISARLDDGATCGPRAYLRPGAHLLEGAKAGTSVEIKNSTIGRGSKVPHLSYIGDTTMGAGVNIGAGTITCNYDGARKHPTTIGDDVFVGSDTMLVAPVSLGDGVTVGAGSVITHDVAGDRLVVARAKQREFEGWERPRKEQ